MEYGMNTEYRIRNTALNYLPSVNLANAGNDMRNSSLSD